MISGYYNLPDELCQAVSKVFPAFDELNPPVIATINFPNSYNILLEDSKLVAGTLYISAEDSSLLKMSTVFNRYDAANSDGTLREITLQTQFRLGLNIGVALSVRNTDPDTITLTIF